MPSKGKRQGGEGRKRRCPWNLVLIKLTQVLSTCCGMLPQDNGMVAQIRPQQSILECMCYCISVDRYLLSIYCRPDNGSWFGNVSAARLRGPERGKAVTPRSGGAGRKAGPEGWDELGHPSCTLKSRVEFVSFPRKFTKPLLLIFTERM